MVGMRFATIDLPLPGGPIITILNTVPPESKKWRSKNQTPLIAVSQSGRGFRVDSQGRRWSIKRYEKGCANDAGIVHLPELLRTTKNRNVVLMCRVSTDEQKENGNLKEAVSAAVKELESYGCNIVAIFEDSESNAIYKDRFLLDLAIGAAEEHGAILVAPSRCRFFRARGYDGTIKSDWPSMGDFSLFRVWLRNVQVATLLHPDQRARSAQTKRGQLAKGGRIGRRKNLVSGPGATLKRKRVLAPLANELRRQGFSYREIAESLRREIEWKPVTFKTVNNWLRGV